ncbi:16S rRNA (cytidine(1402)-2'-O)-methyltransferase [Dactylosporangium vinaceum]|uniref:Ribosomal RNA small subunit methyltransferase I n=1 Tax=Dactylosporangium vinaceum TaxID=53362 RepID=A0ABV5MIH2_9ACTN|nr:16S rRNA (cytidine(1402)-2'-O)-methyltransferase [Dactylosporangium vinaceum]UAB97597.1 16S rRNA (cytidine(1402)-2'-O)-methyltransferase [Dactylosporangium vinaceum]
MARSTGSPAERAAEVARQVLAAPKYRSLDEALVSRLAQEAAERFKDRGEAVKWAKRKLHQAFGAFVSGSPAQAVSACVAKIAAGADPKEAAREAMRAHASSAERVDWLDPFYATIEQWCGPASSVVDLACGLNALALPWMALAPDATYTGLDVDRTLAEALGTLDTVFPVRVTAATADLVADPPRLEADVALVLKTLTTVEQQRSGAAQRLIAALDCRHVVVTLPRRSLSGKRGYADDADAIVGNAIQGTGYGIADTAAFGDEAMYHLVRVAAAEAGVAEAADPASEGGALTLVGTPIGNLGDLSDGALAALRAADVVCAEDTRRTRKLLSAYDLHPAQLVSVREHNEERSAARVLDQLRAGRRVALVSDAGMPMLSDPGQRVARHVLDGGGELRVAPGPDAASTALLLSGLPAQRWCFEGFLPAKGAERAQRVAAVTGEPRTVVLYEAPHRLLRTLDDLVTAAGAARPVAVLNDLTKFYERAWRGALGQVRDELAAGPEPRGEFVIVLGGQSPR